MENNTNMQQYLDPQFIYTAMIQTRSNGNREYHKAYAVNKAVLCNYAKWVDAYRFDLTDTFEITDGTLSKEGMQLDSCEALTKQEFRDYLGKDCKFMPGELAIAKDNNKYAITTNGWQGVVLAVVRRAYDGGTTLVVQSVNGSDTQYIVEESAFRAPYDTEVPPKNMFAEFDKLFPNQQEEILETMGLRRWAKVNELEFTYDDAKKCIAAYYGDDDYMHSEYSDVYSEDGDMTFIMRYDYYHLDGTMDTNVTGFYCGKPNEHDDEIYKETVVAKSEGIEDAVICTAGKGSIAIAKSEEE